MFLQSCNERDHQKNEKNKNKKRDLDLKVKHNEDRMDSVMSRLQTRVEEIIINWVLSHIHNY